MRNTPTEKAQDHESIGGDRILPGKCRTLRQSRSRQRHNRHSARRTYTRQNLPSHKRAMSVLTEQDVIYALQSLAHKQFHWGKVGASDQHAMPANRSLARVDRPLPPKPRRGVWMDGLRCADDHSLRIVVLNLSLLILTGNGYHLQQIKSFLTSKIRVLGKIRSRTPAHDRCVKCPCWNRLPAQHARPHWFS